MKLKNKLSILASSLVTTLSTVVAHSGEDPGTTGGMMWDGSMMHNAGHMTGYNMWGMGWVGAIVGLAFWALVILGIIYLYKLVTEKEDE